MTISKKIIIHVPHASIKLPKRLMKNIVPNYDIKKESVFEADYLVDKFLPNNIDYIKLSYSRMFCDVERFRSDYEEEMFKYGMGVIYTKDSKGIEFKKINDKEKDKILKKYYDKHHKKLTNIVDKKIKKYGECYIIDLHSFSDSYVKLLLNKENNPDICLGYEESFCDKNFVDLTKKHFEKYGYTVKINYPYKGSIVPLNYYKTKDKRVKSLMIEINKRIYLESEDKLNNLKFEKLNKCFKEYFKILE